jgi:hypothetical protein
MIHNIANTIIESIQRLAADWTTEGSKFEYRKGQEFSPSLPDQPPAYLMDTEDFYQG